MKVIVTGALGYIGSRLVRQLPALIGDLEVVMVHKLSTQRSMAVFDLPDGARYRFVEANVCTTDLRPLIDGAAAVIHLAAITGASKGFENGEAVERNNYEATRSVAHACAETGAPMVHASTTSVYGPQSEHVDEECSPEDPNPESPYAEIKLREEKLITELSRSAGLHAIICRFGSIFGPSPGMRFHSAVNKFCWQAVMGLPLTVWKTAYDQRRPYLDLGDAVRAVAFIVERNLFDGRAYNLVTTNATVRNVVDCIRTHEPEVKVEFVESEIMNRLSYDVASTRLSEAGFEFCGDLDKGIAEILRLLGNANRA